MRRRTCAAKTFLAENETNRAWAMALLAAGAAYAPTVSAQSATTPGVDEVVVRSTKLGKSITELTQSVTIVTEDVIQGKAYSDFTEVLRHQAGIEFKQAGGPGQFNYPKMRGFGTSDILVVVDGVKINEASSGGVGHLLGQIDPNSIERIEILRGPQAVLYGANSTAGVISITTKSGRAREGGFNVEAGSLDWRRAAFSFRDTLAGKSGELRYSVNLSKTDSGNVHPEEFTRDETLQAKLDYNRERIGLGLSVWQTDNAFQYAELDEAYCCQTRETWWGFQTPDPNQVQETKDTVIGAYFSHTISEVWSQRLQVGSMSKSYDTFDAANGLLGHQPAPYDNFQFPAYTGPIYQRGELVPVYDVDTDVAAFYRNENTQIDYNLVMNLERVGALLGIERLDQRAWQWGSYGASHDDETITSFYGSGEIDLGEHLILALGLRSDDFDSWGRKSTGNFGIAFELEGGTTIYTNFGTSFTAPTMSQLFNPTYGVPTLRPQNGETTELGVRHIAADGRFEIEGTFWHSNLDDVIVYDGSIVNPRSSTGLGQYTNRDRQRTQGLELTWRVGLTETLALSGNYTYTESDSKAVGGDWTRTVQIAKHKGNLGIDYHNDKLYVSTNAYYAGPRLRWAGDIETEPYWRLDASGRLNLSESISVFVRIENLLDEHIEEELGYLQPGRYCVVGLQYRFF